MSPVPYGLGEQHPNHYLDILHTIRENWRHPLYAWRILSRGVCDGCALGVAGFADWTIDGVHLCTTRLHLLRTNTMDALPDRALEDVGALRERSGSELRELGRLGHPYVRRHGEPGFHRTTWDEALELAADGIRTARAAGRTAAGHDRFGFYLTSRGITNEVYYVAQKVARFLGTNNVDNAARVCHAPSTGALKAAVGAAATTISYTDLFAADLVVFFGADVANAQPVVMKYLYLARKNGLRVAVVNPFREPGLDRYWVPSNLESALFGTRMTDEWFAVHVGGDVAFLDGVLKCLIARGGVDEAFVREHTTGWDDLVATLDRLSFDDLERWSGATRADMERFAEMYAKARSAVLVWSMGMTQHVCGTDNVRSIVNLALARGNVGRPGAGLMPIRGHSGVQGGAEMGAYATVFPGGATIDPESAAALSAAYGFEVRPDRGLTAAELVEAAGRGEIEVLWSSGGNFLDTLPDPRAVRDALERVPVRVHTDVVVSSQMLVDPPPGGAVVLLPAMTRYEQPGGGTETTTERRIAFSPEIPGHRVGEAWPEWRIYLELARRVEPDGFERAGLGALEESGAIRDEIARVIPAYDGIQSLRESGDQVQWGGERLCDGWVFPTPDGKAHFTAVAPAERSLAPGEFLLATRRGKQFNSMIWRAKDPLTGGARDAVFIAAADASRLGLDDGAPVTVRSATGAVGGRLKVAPIREGNVQMFWPEANVLVAPGIRDASHVPDYNAVVRIEPRRVDEGAWIRPSA
ncbi:MAG TPA: FdhF/YdeP family oxidoreductase [Candidatus Limnocylindrales bacterium]|nr:FdhF/YdeP family oxidoreductase [Candidatus Limnocylindrales bacterium]